MNNSIQVNLNPYLNFGGLCQEAMLFYQQCFGGELSLQKISDSAIAGECPQAIQHQILHSMLKSDSLILMGTDMPGPDVLSSGNDVALALHGTEMETMKNLFLKLSQNGEILEQWSIKPWGDYFGMIKDRFGKRWMLNLSPQNYEQ